MNQLVKTTDLLTIDPVTFVAQSYAPFTEALEAAIAKAPSLTYEISTKTGMEVAKEGRALFRNIRTSLEKKRAAAKAPILEIGKLLDSRAKEIVQRIEPFEAQFDNDIKAEEQRIEAEKAAKAKAEAQRQADMQAGIDNIKNAPLTAINLSSSGIQTIIDHLNALDTHAANFAERGDEAEFVRKEAVAQLQSMMDGKRAQEQLAVQQEAARLESERIARELEAQRLAEEKAQREAMAAQATELARQKAEMDQRARELAEAEANVRAAQEAILAAERAKMEDEVRAKQEAENLLVESIWLNARRIEADSVPYIEKAIASFESGAKDWENDPRPRVANAISEARKEMQSKLLSANRPVYSGEQKPITADHVSVDARRPSRAEIIALVSNHFGLSTAESIVLLMREFGYQEEAA